MVDVPFPAQNCSYTVKKLHPNSHKEVYEGTGRLNVEIHLNLASL